MNLLAPHQERRDPELVVPGPPNLPPLHEYQEKIVDQIHGLLFGAEEHPRGLISLPTGAGKTRVAIQALVEALFNRRPGKPGPVDSAIRRALRAGRPDLERGMESVRPHGRTADRPPLGHE